MKFKGAKSIEDDLVTTENKFVQMFPSTHCELERGVKR